MKTIPISVRISQEDATFINQLQIDGATTASEKLRALIVEARQRRARQLDYLGCFQMLREQLTPVTERIKKGELEGEMHSEILARVVEWLPDFVAYLMATVHPGDDEITAPVLVDTEKGVTDRVFRLLESMVQLAVTRECPCYTPELMRSRIRPVLQLAEVISRSIKEEGESRS